MVLRFGGTSRRRSIAAVVQQDKRTSMGILYFLRDVDTQSLTKCVSVLTGMVAADDMVSYVQQALRSMYKHCLSAYKLLKYTSTTPPSCFTCYTLSY